MSELMKFHKVILLLLAIIILGNGGLRAQHPGVQKETNVSRLQDLSSRLSANYEEKKGEAWEYARERGWPVQFTDKEGNYAELQYLDERGLPVYYRTLNAGAARTTGVDALRPGGSLNLSLTGKGMKVGVWDGGRTDSHIEFGNRASQKDGAAENSNHATHVTGTIIAGGANSSARGMAYEAEAVTFDWNDDMSEMAKQASQGLLLSNHSYGTVLGWGYSGGEWKWYGGADADEDYRFGYYDRNHSQTIDQIMFDAPYYTIVWAAGNDRTDQGDGSKEADGPYDAIGPEGAAKNNIVVGAVEKLSSYTGPESVKMSSFSSWGPVDDGRIKPDIVGAGVSIFSPVADGDDQYSTMSGTSMAAPNVTGSLLLLQQLYARENAGRYMRSSTLRGLMIHTAREAGPTPGPDYMFGWGLLNAEAAAKAILNTEAGKEYNIEEQTLQNNEVKTFKVRSDGTSPLKITIAWIDPAGTPPSASINPRDLMLVNDLDLRIVDGAGNNFTPWILDPENPSFKAAKGDNFRDNVEVVYLQSPGAQEYIVQVSHKGELTNGQQQFSIITEYTNSQAIGENFYWINGTGNWNDGSHWSRSSGGSPAGVVPSAKDKVVFDEASGLAAGTKVTLANDAAVYSLKWNAPGANALVLENDAQLTIQTSVLAGSNEPSIEGTGSFKFIGEGSSIISLNGMAAPGLSLILDNPEGQWTVNSNLRADKVIVNNGQLSATNVSIEANNLLLEQSLGLDLSNSTLHVTQTISFPEEELVTIGNTVFRFSPLEDNELHNIIGDSLDFHRVEVLKGNVRFSGPNFYNMLEVHNAVLTLLETNTARNIRLLPGASVIWSEGDTLRVEESFEATGEAGNLISLRSASGEGAYLELDARQKVCLNYLQVTGVTAIGGATFNAGINSTVETADGWQEKLCEDVLYAEFAVEYACAGAIANLDNQSTGTAELVEWKITNPEGQEVVLNEFSPTYTFENTGTYQVTLTVMEGEDESRYAQAIEIQENSLKKPVIVLNDNTLAATTPSDRYQWYRDGEPIEGATSRTYNTEGRAGMYQVTVLDDICNAASDPVVISSVLDDEVLAEAVKGLKIYANPVENVLTIEGVISKGKWEAQVFDVFGRSVTKKAVSSSDGLLLDLHHLKRGMYLLKIDINSNVYTYKILKK